MYSSSGSLQLKQIGNTVIHEEYLPVTAHLKIDGVGNDFLVEGCRPAGLYPAHV